jgi:hypothetical protein
MLTRFFSVAVAWLAWAVCALVAFLLTPLLPLPALLPMFGLVALTFTLAGIFHKLTYGVTP